MFRYWMLIAQLSALALASSVYDTAGDGGSTTSSDEGTTSEQSDTGNDDATDTEDVDSGDDDDADVDEAGSTSTRVQGTSFERGFNNLMERFGNNARRVAEHLYRQDYKHRESLRLARGEVETLKQRVPKDGSRVVDRTTARELAEYRKLGKPTEVQQRLQAGVDASTALKTREKDDVLRDVAEVVGWNYKALKGAASDLDYTIKEVDDGRGGKKKVAHVVTRNGADATETPATEWFTSNRDYLLPSLTANSGNGAGGSTYGQQFIVQPVGQQRSNGSTQPQSAASAILSRYDEPKAK
jgi:hypothetical protein